MSESVVPIMVGRGGDSWGSGVASDDVGDPLAVEQLSVVVCLRLGGRRSPGLTAGTRGEQTAANRAFSAGTLATRNIQPLFERIHHTF